MFILQKEIHDLKIQLTAIATSEQHCSKQVEDLKIELEKEKYVFHYPCVVYVFNYYAFW